MLELNDLTYRYPPTGGPTTGPSRGRAGEALSHTCLEIRPGEVVGLLGPNGSGKSTLLRCACAQLAPQIGTVSVDGLASSAPGGEREARRMVGLVGQDPDDQLVSTTLFEEVAFGPCNLGLPRDEVEARVRGSLELCGLAGMEESEVATLSGGQRQRAAVAGVLAMRPRYLLMDEACSMLDASERSRMLRLVKSAASRGCGVLFATHDLEEAVAFDRVAVMGQGRVVWEGAPNELLLDEEAALNARCKVSPWLSHARRLMRLGLLPAGAPLWDPEACAACASPLLVARGVAQEADDAWGPSGMACADRGEARAESHGIEVRKASLTYRRGRALGVAALREASLTVAPGEAVCLIGMNGAGKTTLAQVAAGLVEPDAGAALVCGRKACPGSAGYVPQRAEDQLFARTVLEDVMFGPRNMGLGRREAAAAAEEALRAVGLDPGEVGGASPFALSGGQMRRAALAGALALGAPFVVLDEPTVGLDAAGVEDLAQAVAGIRRRGAGVLMAMHDLSSASGLAERAVAMEAGRTTWSGPLSAVAQGGAGVPAPLAAQSLLARFQAALRGGGS